MTVYNKWCELVALMKPQSIIKLGFVWGKNVFGLFKTLIRDWWSFILVLIFYTGLMPGNSFTALLMGMWIGIVLLVVHPSMLPKGRAYYRSHSLFFLLIAIVGATAYARIPYFIFCILTFDVRVFWTVEFIKLLSIVACFFILDAHPTVGEYLRAATILPIKFVVFNLPLVIPLYLVLVGIDWLREAPGKAFLAKETIAMFLLIPMFIVAGSILYRLTVNNNYEDYYGAA